LKVYPDYLTLW